MTYLVVGLGNPGSDYEKTRHNAGFIVADLLVKEADSEFKDKAEFQAEIASFNIADKKVIVAKPWTYMNASGRSVTSIMSFYKIEPSQLIVISDDVSLPIGTLRIRTSGTAGGHNGLKSIIELLKTDQFSRIKIGVDPAPANVPLEAWVLSKFSKDELQLLAPVFKAATEEIIDSVTNGMSGKTKSV